MSYEIKFIPAPPIEIFDALKQLEFEIQQVCGIHANYFGEPKRGTQTAASVEMLRNSRRG